MVDALAAWAPAFGGAAIGLLVIVFIAYGRGTKMKMPPQTSVRKPESNPPANLGHRVPLASDELEQLVRTNRELAKEVAALTQKLQRSERAIKSAEARLQIANQRERQNGGSEPLNLAETDAVDDDANGTVHMSEESERPQEEAAAENSQLAAEIAFLGKKVLNRSLSVTEAEAVRSEGETTRSRDTHADTIQQKLAQITRLQQELQDENSALRTEIGELRTQLARHEANKERLRTAQQYLDGLKVKQEAIKSSVNDFDRDLNTLTEFLDGKSDISLKPAS